MHSYIVTMMMVQWRYVVIPLQVGDFGLSRAIGEAGSHLSTATVGTVTHMPPELLLSGQLRPSCDVYSFGIMLWQLYTGQVPYQGMRYAEIVYKVAVCNMRPVFPESTPKEYRDLAEQCWNNDAAVRPTFEQVEAALEGLMARVDDLGAGGLPSAPLPKVVADAAPEPAVHQQQHQHIQKQLQPDQQQHQQQYNQYQPPQAPLSPMYPQQQQEQMQAMQQEQYYGMQYNPAPYDGQYYYYPGGQQYGMQYQQYPDQQAQYYPQQQPNMYGYGNNQEYIVGQPQQQQYYQDMSCPQPYQQQQYMYAQPGAEQWQGHATVPATVSGPVGEQAVSPDMIAVDVAPGQVAPVAAHVVTKEAGQTHGLACDNP